MSVTALVLVVATVVSVQDGRAQLDKGRREGLEPGDRGQVHYELTVAGQPQRIEIGPAEIAAVETGTSSLAVPPSLTVRPDYRVEFQIPSDRLTPDEPAPEETSVGVVAAGPERVQETPAVKSEDPPPPDMTRIPAGRYAIGLDLADAQFFSQTPRFTLSLEAFWIDNHPAAQQGLTYTEAQSFCRRQRKRLPTELEWEIALQRPGVSGRPGLLEWTASWYRPYPGNTRPEAEYGRRSRVLRGSTNATPDPHGRRFLAPGDSNPRIGFRCARDQP